MDPTGFYHVAFAVPDLHAAMATFTEAVGVQWHEPQTASLRDWAYRIVFSTSEPRIELVEGPVGSPWDVSESGPRFDHLGFWTESLDDTVARWATCDGLRIDYDGRDDGRRFTYAVADSLGVRFEAVDIARRTAIDHAWPTDGRGRDSLSG
ncbi:VOC family protein [Tsukamurella spumae]|uniref:VOC family protein n=1 Tax=Tsukamurella spumae TaxID=44753 RepID=A0A846WYU4_9ACTN|nr:VOC family protein [Tsukamurella spumae]NKY17259.1 VOC family protein [Tsukamurella spumae]